MILGIGLDGKAKLAPYSKTIGINYPVLIGNLATVEKYGVRPIPTTFIIDRKGEIKDKIIGYAPGYEDKIRASFLKLL
jgi:thioredoxin-related protein